MVILKSIIYRNKIYIFGIPTHGNLGDQAIVMSEELFLKENFLNIKIIKVELRTVTKAMFILKKIIGKSTIMIQGGGNLGSLWMVEEQTFKTTIENFPNNKIIVFPQTIYFSNDIEGNKVLEESKKIYNSHKNLYICCREEYTYNYMKKNFPKCNLLLVPDMVLYLDDYNKNLERTNILFCLRKDKEKINNNFSTIKEKAKNYNLFYTDTIVKKRIYEFNRKKELNRKFDEFSKFKLIITDRLHGMVFALLTGTPCIVFNNINYKIKGVYKWIEKIDYIKMYNEKTIDDDFDYLINLNDCHYNNSDIKKKYQSLIALIKNELK